MSAPDRKSEIRELLLAGGLFNAVDSAMLEAIEQELESVRLPGGQTLFSQGDAGDSLYVLAHGRLSVSIAVDGHEQVIGEVGRGQVVGEMAVLTGEPRSATVRAVRDSELIRFSKPAFERVIEKDPRTMTLISRRLISRLRQSNRGTFHARVSTIALVPVHPGVPLKEFAERFVKALSQQGTCAHVSAETAGLPDLSDRHAGSILEEYETRFQYVVYQADAASTEWTQLCIRQADRILLVGRGDQRPGPETISPEIAEFGRAKTTTETQLVLLHPDSSDRPKGTLEWVHALGVDNKYHHVRLGSAPDHERLARILTGHAVGLVLGGGGARGFAHIGVLRAFAECGIPIDFIGGTSMGSVIAAQHAAGFDFETMVAINRKGWIAMDPLRDKTLPVMALLSGRKLDAMIEMMFQDLQIEDLWVKYFCVSANLSQARTMVHQEGPLKKWVRASMAIPGVAPPVFDHGDLLIDGGVLNNLPGDIMKKICGGMVIVVDVSPQKDLTVDSMTERAPTSWEILASRVNPLQETIMVPNVLAIMMRTVMLSSTQTSHEIARDVDLYLRPPIDKFSLFEWKSLEKLADVGYEFARIKLRDWWQQRAASAAG